MRFTFLLSGFIFGLLLLAIPDSAYSQIGGIKGTVTDEKGEPVPGVTVMIPELQTGANTNENGIFTLTKINGGSYSVRITSIGFDTLFQKITVPNGKIVTVTFKLKESYTELDEIVVLDQKIGKIERKEIKTGVTNITSKQIKLMPSIGSPDLAQYLQVTPGVITSGDQGGQIFIRGGTPIQNMTLLDGAIIYNPFHSIGIFSVFDPDYIRSVDLYSAGFGAQYGGRVSSVMDIKTRSGNFNALSVKAFANPFTSGVLLEGPLKKMQNNSGSSFLFSFRNSYLDQSSKILYSYANDTLGIPFGFTDLYGKITLQNGGNRINFFGFNFKDKVRFGYPSDIDWKSYGGGTNFIFLPSSSKVVITGNFAYSSYDTKLVTVSEDVPRKSLINGFNGALNFNYGVSPTADLAYGIQILGFKTDFKFTNAYNNIVNQVLNNTEAAAYFRMKKVFRNKVLSETDTIFDRAVIEPSIRAHFYNDRSFVSFEPRIRAKYNFNGFSLHGAAGIYSQNLVSSQSDLDIVNLFQGIIGAPEDQANKTKTHTLQTAIHYLFGVEIELFEHLQTNIEGWYKDFTQLTNINRFKVFPTDPDFITETGKAYGVDVNLTYENKDIYLYLQYGLAKITRDNFSQEYPASFDRRHTINGIAAYKRGNLNKKWIELQKTKPSELREKSKFNESKWEVGLRYSFGSGFPFTQTQGFFEKVDFSQNGTQTNYVNQNGSLTTILDSMINAGRLPNFIRLDASAKRRWVIHNKILLEINLSLYNALNRDNVFYVDRVRYARVNQLPILPSAGISFQY